jgi:hypothetical protein
MERAASTAATRTLLMILVGFSPLHNANARPSAQRRELMRTARTCRPSRVDACSKIGTWPRQTITVSCLSLMWHVYVCVCVYDVGWVSISRSSRRRLRSLTRQTGPIQCLCPLRCFRTSRNCWRTRLASSSGPNGWYTHAIHFCSCPFSVFLCSHARILITLNVAARIDPCQPHLCG